jgi:Caudovirus prohead serine protease
LIFEYEIVAVSLHYQKQGGRHEAQPLHQNPKKMADLTEYKFVVNDEAVVNRYGYRVLNKGVNTKQFLTNPICLFQHRRVAEWRDDDVMPIGRWTRFELDGTKLIGWVVFSQATEKAKTVAAQVAEKILNACSMGFYTLKISEDSVDLVPEQVRGTVTKCDLLEISIVDVPGNPACVQMLNANAEQIENLDAVLPLLTLNTKPISAMKKENFIAMLLMFGLLADATEEQLMEAAKQQGEALTAAKAQLLKATEAEHQLKAKTLIDMAVASKKLTEAQRPSFEKLAMTDFDAAKTAIDSLTALPTGSGKTVTEQLQARGGNAPVVGTGADVPEFHTLQMTNEKELYRLQAEEPERFNAMKSEYLAWLKKG